MAKVSQYASKLAKLKSQWKKAMEKKPEFGGDVPDGRYRARLTRAEAAESQSSGNLQVAWGAVVVEGESKGENIRWYSQLKTEDNMMYLQRDIARLGFESPEDPSELEAVLAKIASKKPLVILTIKTNGEFQNVRLGKTLTDEEAGDIDETPADDVPAAEPPEEPAVEPAEEPAEEAVEEVVEEVAPEAVPEDTVEVGMRVAFDLAGKEAVGSVTKVNEADETVIVKLESGKAYKVKAEKLRPAPKSKVTKK